MGRVTSGDEFAGAVFETNDRDEEQASWRVGRRECINRSFEVIKAKYESTQERTKHFGETSLATGKGRGAGVADQPGEYSGSGS